MKYSTQLLCFICSTLLLTACAPKYNYQRQTEAQNQAMDSVILVIEHAAFTDDVGKLMNYDIAENITTLDQIEQQISEILQLNGYQVSQQFVRFSGLGLPVDLDFELFDNNKDQEALINPPFLIEASEIDEQTLFALEDLLLQASTFASVPVTKKTLSTLDRYTLRDITEQLNIKENTAFLFIKSLHPRVSAGKSVGVGLLTAVLSLGLSGGNYYAVSTPHGNASMSAVLANANKGDLIWKNYIHSAPTSQHINRLFENFPSNPSTSLNSTEKPFINQQ